MLAFTADCLPIAIARVNGALAWSSCMRVAWDSLEGILRGGCRRA